jgi:predicted MFS family arabinose efflux permease
MRSIVLAGAVALAFADSSIVVLALPELLQRFHASVSDVAWVVTAFNVAVALVAAAIAKVRLEPARAARIGLVVFTAASVACAAAPELWSLVGFRAAQGAGAALLLVASLPLLGDAQRWAVAGAGGAVLGPAAGGALTQLFDWRAIFVAQAPVGALALLAVRRRAIAAAPGPRRTGIAAIGAHAAVGLVSAALVGALFLAVVLLVDAWTYEPLAAAGVVSALPAATLVGAPLGRRAGARSAGAVGAALLAAGLAALALLPAADPAWAAAALAFCGLGIGAAVPALTRAVLAGAPRAAPTVAVRHAGLVLGLLVLTPLLAHDLTSGIGRAKLVGTGLVLDAPLAATTKVPLAIDLGRTLQRSPRGKLPDFRPDFRRRGASAELDGLDERLTSTIRAIVTRSFRKSFLVAALLALAGVVPTALLRRSA